MNNKEGCHLQESNSPEKKVDWNLREGLFVSFMWSKREMRERLNKKVKRKAVRGHFHEGGGVVPFFGGSIPRTLHTFPQTRVLISNNLSITATFKKKKKKNQILENGNKWEQIEVEIK